MPKETPSFSSTPISDGKPKRRPASRTSASRPAARRMESSKEREMTATLNSIYKNDDGRMPDMKQIKIKKNHSFLKSLLGLIVFGGILAAVAWAGFFVLPQKSAFSEDQIRLSITGDNNLKLGATTTYSIVYNNTQNVALKNAVLNIRYPEGFVFAGSSVEPRNAGKNEWDLGTIAARASDEITITGYMYGAPAQEQSWRAFLSYQPENFQSTFQKVATMNVAISESPVAVTVTGPETALAGSDVVYNFKITNQEKEKIDALELQPIFPANFSISSSTPTLSKNLKWTITKADWGGNTTTPAKDALSFAIQGKFGDSTETVMPIKAAVLLPIKDQNYQVAASEISTNLTKNNIALNLAVNGTMKDFSTKPGDVLNITLNLKNGSPEEINNAVVKISLDAPAIKKQSMIGWADITDQNDGNIEGKQISDAIRRGSIVWDSSKIATLKKLKANDEVIIDVRLPIKNGEQIDLSAITEHEINFATEVTYKDASGAEHTMSGSPIKATINSDFTFESRDTVTTENGKETHKINWVINNSFHPLKDVKITADAFGDITLTPPANAPAGTIQYDSAAKRLTWTIADMPESVDVLALPFSITVNKKNPTQNILVSKVHVTATDTITGQPLDFMGVEIPLNQ